MTDGDPDPRSRSHEIHCEMMTAAEMRKIAVMTRMMRGTAAVVGVAVVAAVVLYCDLVIIVLLDAVDSRTWKDGRNAMIRISSAVSSLSLSVYLSYLSTRVEVFLSVYVFNYLVVFLPSQFRVQFTMIQVIPDSASSLPFCIPSLCIPMYCILLLLSSSR